MGRVLYAVRLCLSQWMEVLEAIHEVMRWSDLDAVDPIAASDVALRLGLLYESAALLRGSRDAAGIDRISQRRIHNVRFCCGPKSARKSGQVGKAKSPAIDGDVEMMT